MAGITIKNVGRVVMLVALVASCANGLHFMTMADWGGSEFWPYTTAGERGTAALMAKLAPEFDPKFVLALGDNFYLLGVKDVEDTRFKHTFEDVFDDTVLNMPFYVLAGNHDHYGNVSAQVAYTNRSARWTFPSLWYDFTTPVEGNKTLQIVMVDTVTLVGSQDNSNTDGPQTETMAKLGADQWAWLEATLNSSAADFLLVAGHFPVYSICEHGPTPVLVSKLKPMLEKYNATAYLAGHDHCNEHINEGTGVDYHGIGAAHSCDTSEAHKDDIPAGSLKWHWANGKGGFATMNVTAEAFIVNYYSDAGEMLYSSPPHPPRSL